MAKFTEHRSDADLVRATKAGDSTAFGVLVRRHQRAAIRIAAVAMGSAEGADDVAQEAFVKVHRSIDRFQEDARFEPWLYRIVVNTARNQLRSVSRQRALRLRVASRAAIPAAGPDEIAAQLADRQTLLDAINRLSLDDRLVLTYRWYEQLSEAEIAEAMESRPGTVKSRLSRAMARLRTELGDS